MIQEEIKRLKKAKNAVILAHYYQHADVQDIADFVGDSLELSKIAASVDAKIILFCGVDFMAQTAKILAPSKKVLLAVSTATCPMANMISAEQLQAYKMEHPDRKVVCYVNSTAGVKALSDVCVTSSNAEKIILRLKDDKLLYVPDQNLGNYLKDKYIIDMECWPGHCCIHHQLTVEQVVEARRMHKDALVLIHPEAPLAVLKQADFVGSTSQIIEFASTSNAHTYIIGTEKGIMHPLQKKNPQKNFVLLTPSLSCFDMKLTRLEDVLSALQKEDTEIFVPEDIAVLARKSLQIMMEWS